jgi:hypothetical protein
MNTNLQSDRLLDSVLGKALWESWNEEAWLSGLTALRQIKNSELSATTYLTYAKLLQASAAEQQNIVDQAIALFQQRAKNSFFSGSDAAGLSSRGYYEESWMLEGNDPPMAMVSGFEGANQSKGSGLVTESVRRLNSQTVATDFMHEFG